MRIIVDTRGPSPRPWAEFLPEEFQLPQQRAEEHDTDFERLWDDPQSATHFSNPKGGETRKFAFENDLRLTKCSTSGCRLAGQAKEEEQTLRCNPRHNKKRARGNCQYQDRAESVVVRLTAQRSALF